MSAGLRAVRSISSHVRLLILTQEYKPFTQRSRKQNGERSAASDPFQLDQIPLVRRHAATSDEALHNCAAIHFGRNPRPSTIQSRHWKRRGLERIPDPRGSKIPHCRKLSLSRPVARTCRKHRLCGTTELFPVCPRSAQNQTWKALCPQCLVSALAIMHQMTPQGPRTYSAECRITRHPRECLFRREPLAR